MKQENPLKKLIFITGTDTGVGKTVITAGLLSLFLKKGYNTLAIKPFQTGGQEENGRLSSPDVLFYETISQQKELPEVLNPVNLGPPAAPWVASMLTQTPIELNKIFDSVKEILPKYDLVIVEGAGGLCVPILRNYLMADMARDLQCPMLIVARGSLGTINHTLLTVSYAKERGIPLLGVVVNNLKYGDPVAELNPWVIKELSGVPLLGVVPYSPNIDVDRKESGNLLELVAETLDFNALEEAIFGKS